MSSNLDCSFHGIKEEHFQATWCTERDEWRVGESNSRVHRTWLKTSNGSLASFPFKYMTDSESNQINFYCLSFWPYLIWLKYTCRDFWHSFLAFVTAMVEICVTFIYANCFAKYKEQKPSYFLLKKKYRVIINDVKRCPAATRQAGAHLVNIYSHMN